MTNEVFIGSNRFRCWAVWNYSRHSWVIHVFHPVFGRTLCNKPLSGAKGTTVWRGEEELKQDSTTCGRCRRVMLSRSRAPKTTRKRNRTIEKLMASGYTREQARRIERGLPPDLPRSPTSTFSR